MAHEPPSVEEKGAVIAGEGALSLPGPRSHPGEGPSETSEEVHDAGRRARPRETRWARLARAGNERAFAQLYRRYAPAVHGILISIVPQQEAQDLVQDVFVRALRSIGTLDDPARIAGWLAAIARNVGRDAHRARAPVEALEDEPLANEPLDGPATDERREEAERVLAVLRTLPEAYRETLALRLVEGLPGPEIAARTGMTPGSVRVNLCRGMKLLRERLGVNA